MSVQEDPVVAAFVAAFVAATGHPAPAEAFAFGDQPAQADHLAQLVAAGRKRATAALFADLGHRQDQLPRPGDTAIVLDGSAHPVCVIRTVEVEVAPFDAVDESFAWDEGEGDRSLEYWITEHQRFFRHRCAALGIRFDVGLDVVLERFEMIWRP
jgi:uncharacterized protein YhfF